MKKKFLALVLTLAMVLSLVPATALATDGTSDTTTKDVVYGHYEGNAWTEGAPTRTDGLKDTVTVNKTAEKVAGQNNQYEVTLKVEMKQKETDVPPGAAATVLVIDKSGSMNENNRLPAAKTAAINFLKSYSGFSDSDFNENGNLKNNVSNKNLKRYVSLVTFNDSASVREWKIDKKKESWIDVSTKDGYDKLFKAINKIEAEEGTNLDAALRLADTQMQSGSITQIDQSKKNVIALTDGVPTYYVKEGRRGTSNVSQHGNYGCPDTNAATARSADALKAKVKAVYTVCFGAAGDQCWTKGSAHTWYDPAQLFPKDEHKTDGPTVGDFLRKSIATQPADDSNEQYAYNADNAENLYKVFAAITQTITEGLNEGVVTDGLPTGVTAVEDSGFTERWELQSNEATVTQDGEYNVYTYTKTYTVNVNPATVKTVEVGGANYAPLNTPTTLTVQNGSEEVKIPFPIPAGKVTYSLTGFEKALVTNQNKPDGLTIPSDVTIPANTTEPVTVGENGVTLLYKITVAGNAGAKFTVTDDGATLVPPTDNSITFNQEGSTFSGTVGTTGETVFYVSKHFTQDNIVENDNTKTVSNTATIVPGDNANGPDNDTATETTPAKEPDPETYTVTYQWKEGTEVPEDAALPNAGNPIPVNVGQKHTVASVPKSNVTTNAGKTGSWTCTWDATSNEIQGNAGENIIIKGTWSFQETVAPKGTLTVIKKVEGRTLDQLDQDKFKITVTGPGGYTNDLTLTQADNDVTEGATTATWTIRDLPAGEYTVSEEKADVTGYDCTATYSATNGAIIIVNNDASVVQNQPATDAQASQKVTVTENRTSTMTVTNKYTKKEVEPTPDTSKPDVNKTATDLVNDKTDVTLSVGGKSAKENVAVMFLLDKSTSMGTRTEAAKMLQHLKGLTNTNIIYDVVIFSGTASSTGWKNISDDAAYTDTQENFNNKEPSPGTNMPVGIDKAIQDMETLKSQYSSYAENAYLITISDGITYLWNEDGKTYTVPLLQKEGDSVYTQAHPNVDTWNMMYGERTSIASVYTSFEGFLNTIPGKIQETRNGNYVREYLTETVAGDKTDATNALQISTADPEKSQVSGKYACAPEFSVYYSATKYQELVKQFEKSFALPMPELKNGADNTDNWDQFYPWGRELMLYLQSKSSNSGQGVVHDADAATIFAGIRNEILYQIQSGSITDVIGADFSLTDQTLTKDTFTLTVNGKAVTANAPNGNVITFGTADESSNYPYVLTYYKGKAVQDQGKTTYTITSSDGNTTYTYTPFDTTGEVNGSVSDEFFVLEMNVPVVSLDLKYNLSLTSKRTASGTYEVPTNESATLAYQSANQSAGSVDFNEPTVSYRVKGSSGGHSGGTVTIPDDVPTGLNGKDHYAYVVGYPDGMVYPQKNITRAEVATIFFRLLEDETREANMTKSNSYNDMKDGAWYTCAVSTLSKMGIIKGYEDGSFKPDASISRAEFAAIAARFDPDGDKTPATFSDVSSHWAKDEISIAANHGWIKGYEDGSFKPDQKITRAETMTLVNRVLKRLPETKDDLHKDMKTWPDNQNESAWFYLAVQEATNSHYQKLKKDGTHETWESMRETRDWAALEK